MRAERWAVGSACHLNLLRGAEMLYWSDAAREMIPPGVTGSFHLDLWEDPWYLAQSYGCLMSMLS